MSSSSSSPAAASSSSFEFVLIPADDNRAIESRHASKAGGLTDDELLKHAKSYFGDDGRNTNNMCDITAVTIPTPKNQYQTVSMYSSSSSLASSNKNAPVPNRRANALLVACGHHKKNAITGDAFVGRCIDNEGADVWERVDFTVSDADPLSSWCKIARQPGGGGGSASAGNSNSNGASSQPSSLSRLLAQMGGGASNSSGSSQPGGGLSIVDPNNNIHNAATPSFGQDGGPPVQETWGTWTQTQDEIELVLTVPANTTSKQVKIQFGRNRLSVVVHGQSILQGTTFDPIESDESTYTIQDKRIMDPNSNSNSNSNTGERELCITLPKASPGTTWPCVINEK